MKYLSPKYVIVYKICNQYANYITFNIYNKINLFYYMRLNYTLLLFIFVIFILIFLKNLFFHIFVIFFQYSRKMREMKWFFYTNLG